jgi:hypothetical protein
MWFIFSSASRVIVWLGINIRDEKSGTDTDSAIDQIPHPSSRFAAIDDFENVVRRRPDAFSLPDHRDPVWGIAQFPLPQCMVYTIVGRTGSCASEKRDSSSSISDPLFMGF